MEGKHCDTCMHETLPSGIAPCCNCIAHDEWKPKGEIDLGGPITGIDIGMPDGTKIPVGIDPGAPEGDMTNMRLDWGEIGSEMIGPKVCIDDTESGPVLAAIREAVEHVKNPDA